MNISEEHTLVRSLLQKLGSRYQYTSAVLTGPYVHQPIKIVIGTGRKERPSRGPTFAPEPSPANRPSALAFALSGPASGPETAPERAAPVPEPVTAEVGVPPGQILDTTAPAVTVKRKYRRIFSYYGSKSKIAHLYPAPKHDVVIEPFAGSAAYSALHYERQIHINEKDSITASVWKFLLRPDAMDCLEKWFPKKLEKGASVLDLFPANVDQGFINIIRADISMGSFGSAGYCTIITEWGANGVHQIRDRIEYWIPKIKHWKLTSLDYSQIPNQLATWYIDPPYNNAAGSIYRTRGLNYNSLARWCQERNGQVIVCENEGATWLHFRFITKRTGSFTGRDHLAAESGNEVVWEKGIDPIREVPSDTDALSFALGQTESEVEPEQENKPREVEPELKPELIHPAKQFFDSLEARGHRVLTRNGRLFLSNASKLTEEDEAGIKQWKPELIKLAEYWPEPKETSLAAFLGSAPPSINSERDYVQDVPPDLTGIREIVLNFATDGLDWMKNRPVGVTVATLDGGLVRFLPFRFAGGNLDEEVVKRWAKEQLRGKKITNSKTKFDIHMAREWGVDLEEQGCTFSDVQHTAALLDDHRKRFALDILVQDYLPEEPPIGRLDERMHHQYHAAGAAEREKHTVRAVGKLLGVMRPMLEAEELGRVQEIEDNVIPAVVEMEKNGSPIDLELLSEYGRRCTEAREQLMWEVSREAGFSFEHTASGWKRLIESLNLPVPDSFSEDVLSGVDHPLIRKGQRAAQYASLNSKIFKAYPEHIVDGILRYSINQLASDEGGTVSGRFSIGLVQQVPNAGNHKAAFGDDLFPRRLFIPGAGQYLEADAAQIEFRLLVHYSGNVKLLQAYRDDPKMSFHREMQRMLQAYKPDMIYEHTKNYNFAAQYGARSIKLAVMMGFITAKEGDEIRAAKRWNDPRLALIHEIELAYKRAHPEAGALLDRAAHLAKPRCDDYCKKGDWLHRNYQHRGFVKTLFGRRSRFPSTYKTYIGLNRVLQGTGADIMKIKLAELHRERKRTGFVMRITNHDAALGDATTPETLGLVSEILNQQSVELKVPIIWECGVGETWADCK